MSTAVTRSTLSCGSLEHDSDSEKFGKYQRSKNYDICDLFLNSTDKASSANESALVSDNDDSVQDDGELSQYFDEPSDDNITARDNDNNQVAATKSSSKKHKSNTYTVYGRSDIVLKTILRKMRKQYLTDFNNKTNYIKSKRNRKPQFLVDKLTEFAKFLLKDQLDQDFEDELVFFMGAIFYPKHLRKAYNSNPKKKSEIDDIHSSLYKFT